MTDRIDAAAKVIEEWIDRGYGNPEDNADSAARALDGAGLLAPEMKPEWGVEIEGKIPGTWYRLNLHGLVPHHYADATWLETREEAESLMADVMEGELYLNARFVRRYVTEPISDE